MSRNSQTSRLTESAFIAGILLIFAIIGTLIFPFIDYIYALPAIILAKRHDYKAAIMALVTAGIIASILLGVQAGLYYLVLYTPMAATMSYFIDKDRRPALTIAFSGLAYLISFIILLFIMQLFLGLNLIEYVTEAFQQSFEIQEGLFSNFEGFQEQLESSRAMYDNMLELIIMIMPGILIATSLSMVVINYLVAQKIGKRLKAKIRPLGNFKNFKLPNNIVLGMLVIFGLTMLVGQFNIVDYETLSANVLFLFQIVFFIQGLALVRFLMDKYNINRFLRILIIIFIIINPAFSLAVILAGIADVLFDFRKLKESK
ncbi:MAG: DUF2232 domain-containing protein [Bacillota bacterium]|nr:DUF2232 domain-containing protein [Bacillota bacterium]